MLALLGMSVLLAASSFAVGMLPLVVLFSAKHLSMLSSIGTGLLLGTALGVIIPEGIETLTSSSSDDVPVTRIALSLLVGFTFMLVVEQLVSPHAHSHHGYDNIALHPKRPATTAEVEFDAELGDLEDEHGALYSPSASEAPNPIDETRLAKEKAYPLTFGLVVHALADGFALGVSFFPGSESASSSLSFVVFLAIIIHKAPTALALTSALLQTSLPRAQCKTHLAVFSVSTPVSAIVSYIVLTFFTIGRRGDEESWIGTALLLSGGTFLYVATVLQPVAHSGATEGPNNAARVALIVLGMFTPLFLVSVMGHGH